MSDSKRPIAVPWNVRLKYLGIHWAQGPLFLACLLVLGWMWSGRVSTVVVVGQVEAVQVPVPAPEAGKLLNLETPLTAFDRVDRNVTLIARIDVSDALNEMQTLNAERERLQSLITSESERLRLDQRKLELDDLRQNREVIQHDLDRQRIRIGQRDEIDGLRRELSELQQQRRELVLRESETTSQRVAHQQQLKGLQRQREQIDDQVQRNLASSLQLDEFDSQIELKELLIHQAEQFAEAVRQQIASVEVEIAEAQTRWDEASRAWNASLASSAEPTAEYESSEKTMLDIETLLEPLSRALAVQDAKVQVLAARIAANEIRAPVSGMIANVHQVPGTFVRSGDPIVTIASDQVQWIVAYVDQRFQGVLRPADKVEVRIRGRSLVSDRFGHGSVVSLGVQYEAVPEHLRRIPDVVQWGLPVRISIPEGLSLLPGEIVDLVFAVPQATSPAL